MAAVADRRMVVASAAEHVFAAGDSRNCVAAMMKWSSESVVPGVSRCRVPPSSMYRRSMKLGCPLRNERQSFVTMKCAWA